MGLYKKLLIRSTALQKYLDILCNDSFLGNTSPLRSESIARSLAFQFLLSL